MAQVMIDYDEYQRLLGLESKVGKLEMLKQHHEAVISKLNRELSLVEAELADLKLTKEGY